MPKEITIQKDLLEELYIKEQLSIRKIAERLGHGEATVLRYMRIYGVDRRPQHQWRGKKHSKETIDKITKASTGRSPSSETREKLSIARKGKKNPWFSGKINVNGYIMLYKPDHPMSNSGGYLYEHRKVMSEKLGRALNSKEIVHHKNGIKDDNRVENLEIVTRLSHSQAHSGEVECPNCKEVFIFTTQLNSGRGLHLRNI